MVYGDLKYISIQMYIPRAISLKKKNLVALDKALSWDSSQVFGFGSLNPFVGEAWVEPPVAKYSLASGANAGSKSGLVVDKKRVVDLESIGLVELDDAMIDLNIFLVCFLFWIILVLGYL